MINIRHILRLYAQNHTMSEIIVQTGIHRATLKNIIADFKESKRSILEVLQLSDEALAELFKKAFENCSYNCSFELKESILTILIKTI